MSNTHFQFKQFIIHQDSSAMKVTTDACLFGAWVAEIINNYKPARPAGGLKINNCLDIGTGTGLLSLMFAQKNPLTQIDAIEIDTDAAQQAKENADASPWKERINVIHADAREFAFTGKYDLIFSNPPFYENELKPSNSKKNIAHHDEGLLLEELLSIIKHNLSPDGLFCILLPYKRNEEIKNLLLKKEFEMMQMFFVRQSTSHGYFRIMLIGKISSGENVKTEIGELAVWDEKQQYTPEFTRLLKDFYLYL